MSALLYFLSHTGQFDNHNNDLTAYMYMSSGLQQAMVSVYLVGLEVVPCLLAICDFFDPHQYLVNFDPHYSCKILFIDPLWTITLLAVVVIIHVCLWTLDS